MNSKLIWWYLVNTGTVLANGYFRFKPNYIKPFPLPDFPLEKAMILENLVDRILQEKKQNPFANISEIEHRIDEIVFELYDLNEDEMEIINCF